MRWLHRFLLRSKLLLRHDRAGEQLQEELQFHLDQQIAENLAAGSSPEEARRAALRTLLERGRANGDIPAAADLGMLVDMAYGVLWYRLLVGHAPLDAHAARSLAAHLIAAAQAGEAKGSRGPAEAGQA